MRKKLAFIINVFREDDFHSGGEKLFYELVTHAMDKGHIIHLYCSKYLFSGDEPALKLNRVTIIGDSKDYKSSSKIEGLFKCFKKLVKAENYDHVITENITPPMDIAVLQGHSLTHYAKMISNPIEKLIFEIKKHIFIQDQKRWFDKGYNHIIVPSNTLKEELIENFEVAEEKFSVVYPGVDIPPNIKPIDNLLSGGERPVIFGLSAPSFSKKGGYIFLKALSLLEKSGLDFRAKIIYPKANKNPLVMALMHLYKIDELVEFLPYQKHMDDFYNSVDVVVMPSLVETFGLVALEAMANMRAAIVGTNCGASEIIEDNTNGVVFDMNQDSAYELYLKMKSLCLNPKNIYKLAHNGFHLAKMYSWKNSCKSFLAALENINTSDEASDQESDAQEIVDEQIKEHEPQAAYEDEHFAENNEPELDENSDNQEIQEELEPDKENDDEPENNHHDIQDTPKYQQVKLNLE